jgi:hypothetical protein
VVRPRNEETELKELTMKKIDTHITFFRLKRLTILLMFVLSLASSAVAAANDPRAYGKTYGQWEAQWWQWVSKIPASMNPINSFGDVDCTLGQKGSVWFLALPPDERPVVRSCTIPPGKALFFPLLTLLVFDCCGAPSHSVQEKREFVAQVLDEDGPESACGLVSTVDGTKTVFATPIVRSQSPPFFIQLIEDNFFGLPSGESDPDAIADGFWVMLQPLAPGNHVVHFEGGLCDEDTNNVIFPINVTYNLLVN